MFSRHHCHISRQTLGLCLCFLKSPLHSHLYPPPSPWFTPVGLSPPVCSTLTSQSRPHLFPVTRRQQLLLSFTYFITPWIRRCHECGCGCISGRDGEPASESGRHPTGGDLRVLPSALHEWDPVQESKSALFGPPWRPVEKKTWLCRSYIRQKDLTMATHYQ